MTWSVSGSEFFFPLQQFLKLHVPRSCEHSFCSDKYLGGSCPLCQAAQVIRLLSLCTPAYGIPHPGLHLCMGGLLCSASELALPNGHANRFPVRKRQYPDPHPVTSRYTHVWDSLVWTLDYHIDKWTSIFLPIVNGKNTSFYRTNIL